MRRFIFALVILSIGCVIPRPVHAQEGEAAWLLNQINTLRQSKGVHALSYNAQLAAAAYAHSVYLSTNPWTDAHTESNGSTPRTRALAAGYPVQYIGENVVGGGKRDAQSAFDWWMNSPIHYQNMLGNAYREIGIGIAGGERGTYYTLVFGAQDGSGNPPEPVQPVQPQAPAQAQQPAAEQAVQKPPTKVPTRRPTLTPTNTLTPTITYTPRATFTPTFTGTPLPATPTAIVLEVSPQPTAGPQVVALLSSPAAMQDSVQGNPTGSAPAAPRSNDLLRTLIPLAIALQVLVIGGAVVRTAIQRRNKPRF